jgi:TolB protein
MMAIFKSKALANLLFGFIKFYADVFVWFSNGQVKKVSSGDGIYYQACINPEGTHVVYSGNFSGAPRLWKANLETGEIAPLTLADSGARHPAFSWDGERIAFSSDRVSGQAPERIEDMSPKGTPPKNITANIFIMDSNGMNIKQLTAGPYQDQRPTFSPDGKHIAFVSNRSGSIRLWVVSTDGTMIPRPLQEGGWGYRPWYSIDGKWIFFFTGIGGRHRICKISAEGGEVVPLPNDDQGQSHGPFSDPMKQCLLMHSNRDGSWSIWELPLDGSPPRKLMPPGFSFSAHATRSKNGIITFDVVRNTLLGSVKKLFTYF